jgi:predicted sugar kinase
MREFDETMQREGALYAGMSSAGPGFYAFSDSEEKGRYLAAIMARRFGKYMSEMVTARAGQKLAIDVRFKSEAAVGHDEQDVSLPLAA